MDKLLRIEMTNYTLAVSLFYTTPTKTKEINISHHSIIISFASCSLEDYYYYYFL